MTLNEKKALVFVLLTGGGMATGAAFGGDSVGPIEGAIIGMMTAALVNSQLDKAELASVEQEG